MRFDGPGADPFTDTSNIYGSLPDEPKGVTVKLGFQF